MGKFSTIRYLYFLSKVVILAYVLRAMERQQEKALRPHALLFPIPAQGHIAPLLHLAHTLVAHNITVSFLNTEDNHKKILENITASTPSAIRLLSFSDGLPHDYWHTITFNEVMSALSKNAPPAIESIIQQQIEDEDGHGTVLPISVIISDTCLSFTQDIADKYGIPRVAFRTTAACFLSLYHHMPRVDNDLPLSDNFWERWRETIARELSVMKEIRVKDFPRAFLVLENAANLLTRGLYTEIHKAKERAAFVLINTWHELEEPLLMELDKEYSGRLLPVGPLALMAEQNNDSEVSGSLWKEEEGECLQWLDGHREKSVVYVSMGSLASLCEEDLLELGQGLEKSGYPFLWVVRDEMVSGSSAFEDLVKRCEGRVCIEKWAPQKKVLKHPSVGAFLTHCGWNSVSEALSYGVPMVCLPFFVDQPCDRFFVCHVWKCGMELKEKVEKDDVEVAVRTVIGTGSAEGSEIRWNAERIRQSAIGAVSDGGSSMYNIQRLVEFLQTPTSTTKNIPNESVQ